MRPKQALLRIGKVYIAIFTSVLSSFFVYYMLSIDHSKSRTQRDIHTVILGFVAGIFAYSVASLPMYIWNQGLIYHREKQLAKYLPPILSQDLEPVDFIKANKRQIINRLVIEHPWKMLMPMMCHTFFWKTLLNKLLPLQMLNKIVIEEELSEYKSIIYENLKELTESPYYITKSRFNEIYPQLMEIFNKLYKESQIKPLQIIGEEREQNIDNTNYCLEELRECCCGERKFRSHT